MISKSSENMVWSTRMRMPHAIVRSMHDLSLPNSFNSRLLWLSIRGVAFAITKVNLLSLVCMLQKQQQQLDWC